MNRLLPLLALSVTACGPGLPVVDVSLNELPTSSFHVELATEAGGEFARVQPELGDRAQEQCYRIPTRTRLSANGRELQMESPGDTSPRNPAQPYDTCRLPHFKSGTLPDEPRTEFILSDGQTQRRAVFLGLRTARSFRVNRQTQATVRDGQELDIEWLPATDRFDSAMDLALKAEGGTDLVRMERYRVQGNHIYVTFASAPAGRYVLTASGTVKAGVEACEGFSACEAPLFIQGSREISVPLTLEKP